MKRSVLLLTLALATAAAAQQPRDSQSSGPEVKSGNITARQEAPSYSDVYCAGFMGNQPLHKVGYVAGGWGTPHDVRFADGNYVYLHGGGFSAGAQYWIVREQRDLNRYETFRGQAGLLRRVGRVYSDIGRVRVLAIRGNLAITQVEFNCSDIMEGDAAIPFEERQIPELRGKINFDRFAPPNGKLTGKIVLGKDFDDLLGTGKKAYLNVGANRESRSATTSAPCATTKATATMMWIICRSKPRTWMIVRYRRGCFPTHASATFLASAWGRWSCCE
jgi:hypothetical protein